MPSLTGTYLQGLHKQKRTGLGGVGGDLGCEIPGLFIRGCKCQDEKTWIAKKKNSHAKHGTIKTLGF